LDIHTIILAGGKGTRMLSQKAKVLQVLGGITMLNHVMTTANKISNKISVVVGFDKEGVEEEIKKIGINADTFLQKEQIGTADAVKTTLKDIDKNEKILILYGDVPLIKEETLKKLCNQESDLSILTTNLENPTGYGRTLKDKENNVLGIIEEKDADSEQKKIKEIFTGILVAKGSVLKKYIPEINNNNSAKEFYLTDLISIAHKNGFKINTLSSSNEETAGANNRSEQEELEKTLRKMKSEDLLKNGATLLDKSRVDVRGEVKIGSDCVIDVNVIFEGHVELGNNVEIGANTIICNTKIGDDTKILPFSHVDASQIGPRCSIGPYARLREGSVIMDGARIGNFVETKKTSLGRDSKANHFTYLGDAEVGDEVNIGAGTITCNYDGKDKHKTNIGNNSFVGTNSSLVAPVTIGKNAYVGAGSTITKDIPDNALGVGRGKQKNKENWSKTKK
jgi:bifunctional UDP-N-acetylglucosamine pyrophosphorylase/glucosamine-1-phosphate N-acetyltransferase